MKRQITDLAELVGKTIERTADYEGDKLLCFTDGTFAYFYIKDEYDNPKLEIDEYTIGKYEYSFWLRNGIITQADIDEFAAREAEELRLSAEQARSRERAQYERLRAKFEGKPS